jgi:hypothetical protein
MRAAFSGAFGSAFFSSSSRTMSTASSSPEGWGFGHPCPTASRCMSIAAYSGPIPAAVSTTFGSAGVEQQLREVVMGVDDGENERGGAVGIGEDDGSYERGFAPASPSPG